MGPIAASDWSPAAQRRRLRVTTSLTRRSSCSRSDLQLRSLHPHLRSWGRGRARSRDRIHEPPYGFRTVCSHGLIPVAVQVSCYGTRPGSSTKRLTASCTSESRAAVSVFHSQAGPPNTPGGFGLWELGSTSFLNTKWGACRRLRLLTCRHRRGEFASRSPARTSLPFLLRAGCRRWCWVRDLGVAFSIHSP
jgi:hypothetical protein